MSVNSSSSSNVSLLPALSSFSYCLGSRTGSFIFTTFTITNSLLLLPLSIIILHVGHQRWRKQRFALTSHSDLITYHMTVMEMIYMLGSIFYCIGFYSDLPRMMIVSTHVFFISSSGQMSFHTLTCVERYLAVVHPITFMHLRKGSMVRVRNIIIWFVWLLNFAKLSNLAVNHTDVIVMVYFAQQAFSLAVVSYCSLAVLRVLKRAGPGEGGRDKVDQSKKRAFNTIMAIMGTLVFRFVANLVCTAIYTSSLMSHHKRCLVIDSSCWFGLPSTLVLPLLFLHRAGKLPCCKSNAESRQGPS